MPEQLPEWNATGVEPPQSLKDSGWQPGMKPSAQHMNWLLNRAFKCIEELQQAGGNVADLTQTVENLEETVESLEQTVNSNSLKIDTHIKDDSGHARFIGTTSGGDGMACRTDLAPVDLVNGKLVPRKGYAFRFLKGQGPNKGPVTLAIVSDTLPGNPSSATYQILNGRGQTLKAGDLAKDSIVTVAFNGTAFILQGESGVTSPTNGSQTFSTPGTYSFTVPEGVTRLTYRAWGGGGGGGGSSAYRGYTAGGGAGAYASGCLNVTPGDILTVTVGKGGDGGLPNTDENNDRMLLGGTGGASNISGPKNSIPYLVGGGGGGGGSCGFNNNVGRAGGGGSITNGDSFIPYDTPPKQGYPIILGSGLAGYIFSFIMGTQGQYAGSDTYNGGGGAGGSSDAAAGNLAYVNNGGAGASFYTFYPGAKGGDGGYSSDGKDAAGVGAGGGGGGTYKAVGISHKKGGKGGDGRVILYW
ncbi:glycine-rich domain-containing protein [Lysinibacillus fusiformis]